MYENSLRRQVRTEIKKRNYIAYTILLLSLLYFGFNLIFGDMGYLRFRELKQKKHAIEKEVAAIVDENSRLRASLESFKKNDFYVEKNAREEFGLAKPDEYVFIYKK